MCPCAEPPLNQAGGNIFNGILITTRCKVGFWEKKSSDIKHFFQTVFTFNMSRSCYQQYTGPDNPPANLSKR